MPSKSKTPRKPAPRPPAPAAENQLLTAARREAENAARNARAANRSGQPESPAKDPDEEAERQRTEWPTPEEAERVRHVRRGRLAHGEAQEGGAGLVGEDVPMDEDPDEEEEFNSPESGGQKPGGLGRPSAPDPGQSESDEGDESEEHEGEEGSAHAHRASQVGGAVRQLLSNPAYQPNDRTGPNVLSQLIGQPPAFGAGPGAHHGSLMSWPVATGMPPPAFPHMQPGGPWDASPYATEGQPCHRAGVVVSFAPYRVLDVRLMLERQRPVRIR